MPGAAGAVQVWYGGSHAYRKRLSLPPAHAGWMDKVCVFGLVARGVVFAIVGGFLVYAAFTVTPENAAGTADAFADTSVVERGADVEFQLAITNTGEAMTALRELQDETELEVEITRRGRPQTLTVSLR